MPQSCRARQAASRATSKPVTGAATSERQQILVIVQAAVRPVPQQACPANPAGDCLTLTLQAPLDTSGPTVVLDLPLHRRRLGDVIAEAAGIPAGEITTRSLTGRLIECIVRDSSEGHEPRDAVVALVSRQTGQPRSTVQRLPGSRKPARQAPGASR
jgi:hypothetical protein